MFPKTGITGTGLPGNVMVAGGRTTPHVVGGTSKARRASARPVEGATGKSVAATGAAAEGVIRNKEGFKLREHHSSRLERQ